MNFPYKKRKKHRFYCKFFHPKDNIKKFSRAKKLHNSLYFKSSPWGRIRWDSHFLVIHSKAWNPDKQTSSTKTVEVTTKPQKISEILQNQK